MRTGGASTLEQWTLDSNVESGEDCEHINGHVWDVRRRRSNEPGQHHVNGADTGKEFTAVERRGATERSHLVIRCTVFTTSAWPIWSHILASAIYL